MHDLTDFSLKADSSVMTTQTSHTDNTNVSVVPFVQLQNYTYACSRQVSLGSFITCTG